MNVYDVITQKIIEKLNKGCVPWHKGWFTRPAVSHETGRPYSFLNQILLEGNGGECKVKSTDLSEAQVRVTQTE